MSFDESCVYIVDDDKAVSSAITGLVESVGLRAVAFSGGQEFLDAYDGSEPGCLVLDIRMPDISGINLQSRLAENGIPIPLIFITGHGDVPTATEALKNGALDFFEKPFNDRKLLERIQEALAKDLRDREALAVRHNAIERLQQLSNREKQVLDLIMAGKSNKAMALDLGLSQSTIEMHRANVMKRTKADSLAQLVTLVNSARQER